MPLKKGGEVPADPLYNFNHALQRWHHTQRPRLVFEDYVEGRMVIHVHYVLGSAVSEMGDYCVVLKCQKDKVAVEHNGPVFHGLGTDLALIENPDGWQKQFVFVGNVEVVKEHEGTFIPASGSVVRLQPLEHCKCFLPDPCLQFFFSSIERGRLSQEGEIGFGALLDATRGLPQDKRPKQMVESTSCVVEAISNEERPLDNRRLAFDPDAKYVLPGFSIRFLDNGIGFSASSEGLNGRLESAKVFLCPNDLRSET